MSKGYTVTVNVFARVSYPVEVTVSADESLSEEEQIAKAKEKALELASENIDTFCFTTYNDSSIALDNLPTTLSVEDTYLDTFSQSNIFPQVEEIEGIKYIGEDGNYSNYTIRETEIED